MRDFIGILASLFVIFVVMPIVVGVALIIATGVVLVDSYEAVQEARQEYREEVEEAQEEVQLSVSPDDYLMARKVVRDRVQRLGGTFISMDASRISESEVWVTYQGIDEDGVHYESDCVLQLSLTE